MHYSIILPTIGRSSLDNAVESVLNQTYKDWNLYVIADGCSFERNLESKVMLLLNEGGPHNDSGASARNLGAKMSHFYNNWQDDDWLCYIDDDDEWLPHHLEIISNLIKDNPTVDMIKTSGQAFRYKHKHSKSSKLVKRLGEINTVDIMTVGMAHSRKLFNKTLGWTIDLNKHDRILWDDMLIAGGKSIISNEVTFNYER